MAFLSGAIARNNLGRFRTLIKKSRIARLYGEPQYQKGYYVVDCLISMAPEQVLRTLEEHEKRTSTQEERSR